MVFGCISSPQKLMVRTGISPASKIGLEHITCTQFESVKVVVFARRLKIPGCITELVHLRSCRPLSSQQSSLLEAGSETEGTCNPKLGETLPPLSTGTAKINIK